MIFYYFFIKFNQADKLLPQKLFEHILARMQLLQKRQRVRNANKQLFTQQIDEYIVNEMEGGTRKSWRWLTKLIHKKFKISIPAQQLHLRWRELVDEKKPTQQQQNLLIKLLQEKNFNINIIIDYFDPKCIFFHTEGCKTYLKKFLEISIKHLQTLPEKVLGQIACKIQLAQKNKLISLFMRALDQKPQEQNPETIQIRDNLFQLYKMIASKSHIKSKWVKRLYFQLRKFRDKYAITRGQLPKNVQRNTQWTEQQLHDLYQGYSKFGLNTYEISLFLKQKHENKQIFHRDIITMKLLEIQQEVLVNLRRIINDILPTEPAQWLNENFDISIPFVRRFVLKKYQLPQYYFLQTVKIMGWRFNKQFSMDELGSINQYIKKQIITVKKVQNKRKAKVRRTNIDNDDELYQFVQKINYKEDFQLLL